MPIQVKLFGDLRKKIKPNISGTTSLRFQVDNSDLKRVEDLLKKINIGLDEITHIFVNGKYSGPRKIIQDGDVVAFFPRNMSVLYKWHFIREEDE